MKNILNITRPGTHYNVKTGKLYTFSSRSIMVVEPWPKPRALMKNKSRQSWFAFQPNISIPFGNIEEIIKNLNVAKDKNGQLWLPFLEPPYIRKCRLKELAWSNWYKSIPVNVLEGLSMFPERQWNMLQLLAFCGDAAYDLMKSNPALFFILASSSVFLGKPVKRPMRKAATMFRAGIKQRDIIGFFGFPATKSARKIVAKIDFKAINIPNLLYVRKALFDQSMIRAMSHLPRLNSGVLRVVTDALLLKVASPVLLEEISCCNHEDECALTAQMIKDCVRKHRFVYPDRKKIKIFRSRDELISFYGMINDYFDKCEPFKNSSQFTTPPVPGTGKIVPLLNEWEVVREGLDQNNCVAECLDMITESKNYYLYKILKPERCTLGLSKAGKYWKIDDIKSRFNKPVSQTTRDVVRYWFENKYEDFRCFDDMPPIPLVGL